MSEAIKVEILAEDKASAVIAKAAREAEQAAQKLEKTKQANIDSLKLERLQFEQGAEAAEAFRLELLGLDKATAQLLASEKAQIAAQKQQSAEAERQTQATKASMDSLAKTKKTYIDSLKIERLLLEQGEEAAEAYRLELQGLDSATAKALASQRQVLIDQKQSMSDADKQAQATTRKTKATIEFFGTISTFTGAGTVGSLAGQMAGLAEKTGQFSAIAKESGIAALALKGGLVGAAVSIAALAGNEIRKLIDDTEGQLRRAEKLIAEMDKLTQKSESKLSEQLRDRQSFAAASGDIEGSTLAEVDKLTKEIAIESELIQKAAKELEKLRASNRIGVHDRGGRSNFEIAVEQYSPFSADNTAFQIAAQEKTLANLKNEQQLRVSAKHELMRTITVEKELADMRSKQTSIEPEPSMLNYGPEDDPKARAEAGRLAKLHDNELARLQEEVVLLEEGKAAAHALRLERQGMSKEDAMGFAAAQEKLDQLQSQDKQQQQTLTATPELQARESRLLTTGRDSSDDPQKQIAKSTEDARKIQEQSRTILAEMKAFLKKMAEKPGLTVAVAK